MTYKVFAHAVAFVAAALLCSPIPRACVAWSTYSYESELVAGYEPTTPTLRGLSMASSIQKGRQNLLRVSVRSPLFILGLVIVVFVVIAGCILMNYCCFQRGAIDPDDEPDPDLFDPEEQARRRQLASSPPRPGMKTDNLYNGLNEGGDSGRPRKGKKSRSPRKSKDKQGRKGSKKSKRRRAGEGDAEESESDADILRSDTANDFSTFTTGSDEGLNTQPSSFSTSPYPTASTVPTSGQDVETAGASYSYSSQPPPVQRRDDESESSAEGGSKGTSISVTFDSSQVYEYREAVAGSNPLSKRGATSSTSPLFSAQTKLPMPEPAVITTKSVAAPRTTSLQPQPPAAPSYSDTVPASLMDSLVGDASNPPSIPKSPAARVTRDYRGGAREEAVTSSTQQQPQEPQRVVGYSTTSSQPDSAVTTSEGDLSPVSIRRESLEAAKSRRPSMAAGFTGAMMMPGPKRGPAAAASRLSGGAEMGAPAVPTYPAEPRAPSPPPPVVKAFDATPAAPARTEERQPDSETTPQVVPAARTVETVMKPPLTPNRAVERSETSPVLSSSVRGGAGGIEAQSDQQQQQPGTGGSWRRRIISSHTMGVPEEVTAPPPAARPPVPPRRSSIKAGGAPKLTDDATFSI